MLMIATYLAGALLSQAAGQKLALDPEPEAEDIVVTAAPDNKCRLQLADKTLTDAEFKARAAQWKAGTPVRVIARNSASISCLTKIAFKLADQGVRKITFVDPSGKQSAGFPELKTGELRQNDPMALDDGRATIDSRSIPDIEHRFVSSSAAKLILAGKCDEAKAMALQQGDLDAAANVVLVCRGN